MPEERALIGWDEINSYIESRWGIPQSTVRNYRKEMRDCRAVLKRGFGKIPNRRIRVFAATDRIDKFIEMKFKCSSTQLF